MATETKPQHTTSPRTATSWRVALRIARRDAWRNRGRTAVVFAMIMLPVLLVVAGATLARTVTLSPVELLPRQMGSADASIRDVGSGRPVAQDPYGGQSYGPLDGESPAPAGGAERKTEDVIAETLGPGTRVVPVAETYTRGPSETGSVTLVEADLADPMLSGFATLREGRLPTAPGEVAVTEDIVRQGKPIGSTVELRGYEPARVVGVVGRSTSGGEVLALPGGLTESFDGPFDPSVTWLVTAPGGVSWPDVLALNQQGLMVYSRQVITDPPSDWAFPGTDVGDGWMAASNGIKISLLVAMVLLELVLLAGPAFAVGAAKQTRGLGLIAAQGGDRRDLRRIVLAQAVIIGGAAVVSGAVLGVLLPLSGHLLVGEWGGPFEVRWTDVLIVMAFGLFAAVAAAVLPARAVARLNPAAALAGYRPQPRQMRWPAGIAVVLIVLGSVLALLAAGPLPPGLGDVQVAIGSVLLVVGAVLLAPLALAVFARLASPAPATVRYALRDMCRNQLRSAPAVGAIIAIVAGAMTVGIIGASEVASSKAFYTPSGPPGQAVLTMYSVAPGEDVTPEQWQRARDTVLAGVPEGRSLDVLGMPSPFRSNGPVVFVYGNDLAPVDYRDKAFDTSFVSSWYDSEVLVGRDGLLAVREAMSAEAFAAAANALADGRAVLLSVWDGPTEGAVRLDVGTVVGPTDETSTEVTQVERSLQVPATAVRIAGTSSPAIAVLPESVVAATGLEPRTAGVLIRGTEPLNRDDAVLMQDALEDATLATSVSGNVNVAEPYRGEFAPVMIVVLAVALLLALVGAATASLLALSEARTDLVTLGEVGASPGVRRRIAGAYGACIVLLGALLGVVVGIIPGVAAVRWNEERSNQLSWLPEGVTDSWGNPIPDSFLTVPWQLVVGLVVGLPLFVGLLLFLSTRSRLPRRVRMD